MQRGFVSSNCDISNNFLMYVAGQAICAINFSSRMQLSCQKLLCLIAISIPLVLLNTQLVLSEDIVQRPKIEVEDPFYSFGTVTQGDVVSHIFKVKNVGTSDLIIDKAVPSCGCTAALPPEGPIPPGKEGAVKVTFDTAGFIGDKIKTVRLFSNDTVSQAPILSLRGSIDTIYTVTPPRLSFGDVIQGESSSTKSVTIQVKDISPYKIKEIKSFSGSLVVDDIQGTDTKKSFSVRVNTSGLNGEYRDRLLVTLVDKSGQELIFNIPAVASIKSEVQASPQTISFGVISGSKEIKKSFKIHNNTKKPLQIENAISDHNAIRLELAKNKDPRAIEGTIILDPTLVTSDLRSAVRVRLTSPREQEILINVYGIIAPK